MIKAVPGPEVVIPVILYVTAAAVFAYLLYEYGYRQRKHLRSALGRLIQSLFTVVWLMYLFLSLAGLMMVGCTRQEMEIILTFVNPPILIGTFILVCFMRRSTALRDDLQLPSFQANLQITIARIGMTATWMTLIVATAAVFMENYDAATLRLLLAILAVAATNALLMGFIPWKRIDARPVLRIWAGLSVFLVTAAMAVAGSTDVSIGLFYIVIIVLTSSYLRLTSSILFSLLISIIYSITVVWILPAEKLPEASPWILAMVSIFIITAWLTAVLSREGRRQFHRIKDSEEQASQLESRVMHLSTLNEITGMVEVLNPDMVIKHTLKSLMKLFASDAGHLMLWDNDRQQLVIKYYLGEAPAAEVLDAGQDVAGEAAARKSLVHYRAATRGYFTHVMYPGNNYLSAVACPILFFNKLLGCLTLFFKNDRGLNYDERNLLNLVCERVAIALENARMYEETEKAAFESRMLYETARDIVGFSSVKEVLQYAAVRLTKITGMEKCVAAVLNEKTRRFNVTALYGDIRPDAVAYEVSIDLSAGGLSIKNGQAVVVEDADNTELLHRPTVEFFGVKSTLIVPIMSGNRVFGAFYVFNSEYKTRIDSHTVELAEAFARLVSIAVDNLKLLESLNQRIEYLTSLNDISFRINAHPNLQETLDFITASAARILKKQGIILALFDEEGWLAPRATYGISERLRKNFRQNPREGLAELILADGRPHAVWDYATMTKNPNPFVLQEGFNTIMGAPLWNDKGEIIGILYTGEVESYQPPEEDINFATLFANQASIAIANAALYEEQKRTIRVLENLYDISDYMNHLQKGISTKFLTEKTATLLEAEHCIILRYDETEGVLRPLLPGYNTDAAGWSPDSDWSLSVRRGLGYKALYSWEPRIIEPGNEAHFKPFKEILCVRLGTPAQAFGVLIAAGKKAGRFSQEDINLLSMVAHQINSYFEKDRLLEAIRIQVQNLTDLMDVANAIQGSVELEEILNIIVSRVRKRFNGHTCQINLLNEQNDSIEIAAYRGFPVLNQSSENAKIKSHYINDCPLIRQNAVHVFSSFSPEDRCPLFPDDSPVKSYMCAPLRIDENRTGGALHVTSLKDNAFTQEDVALLSSYATEASLALQRGQLFAAIAEEKSKIEAIIQSIDDPLAVFSTTGEVIMVNEAFYSYFSVLQKDIIGNRINQIIARSPYNILIEGNNLEELVDLTLNKAYRNTTACIITSPSRQHFIRVILTPVLDADLNVTGAVAFFHDVTELQSLLNQLAQEKLRAEEANRLKSEFLANVSHELRTPLNSIIGYTQCILDGLDGPVTGEQSQDLKRVVENADHLLRLINDILDLSRIESGKMDLVKEAVEPQALITDVAKSVEPLVSRRGLSLNFAIEEGLPVIYTDGFRVRQILNNLISNAIKFTEEGSITLGASYNPERKEVLFWIRDTGIGISRESLPYIFEEFRQADGSITRHYGGSGLGLSICRSLVQILGGTIWVESVVGEGSCFFFTIPVGFGDTRNSHDKHHNHQNTGKLREGEAK